MKRESEPGWKGHERLFQQLLKNLLASAESDRRTIIADYPITCSDLFLKYIDHMEGELNQYKEAVPGRVLPNVLDRFDMVRNSILSYWEQSDRGDDTVEPELSPVTPNESEDYFERDSAGWPGGAYENPSSTYYEPDNYDDHDPYNDDR
jgi:hypothetical protein